MTVSGRSDFSHLAKFPEVYHGQEVSEALFSCFLLPVAFGIIRESWINVNPDGNLIQFAVAVLVGLTGSGYALKRQVKRDAAEASENR